MNKTLEPFSYGIIEGFFGRVWSWKARQDYAQFLKQHQYQYYIYAPKADRILRRQWQDPWPQEDFDELRALGEVYHQAGLAWGIGLTPFEIHFNYNDQTIAQLGRKIQHINELKPDILAILFDDMRGDCYQMAQIQADVIYRIMDQSTASSFIMCPTYYSDAPVLDKLFGDRPQDYLETLGKLLDPSVRVFWTGPEVCSQSYPVDHLKEVTQKLGRKPFIWDNYPVNDSARMSPFLHLRAFENRPYQMAEWTSGHAANPMNQAYLSQIPLATLNLSYQQKERYSPTDAFMEAARSLCGQAFTDCLLEDLSRFQDEGLEKLKPELKEALIERYKGFQTPYGHEVVSWLKGEYPFDPACLTQ
jgi:hyaluronoglucosaminidase